MKLPDDSGPWRLANPPRKILERPRYMKPMEIVTETIIVFFLLGCLVWAFFGWSP